MFCDALENLFVFLYIYSEQSEGFLNGFLNVKNTFTLRNLNNTIKQVSICKAENKIYISNGIHYK